MLSKKSKYALKAALYLARQDGREPVPISELAHRERIPRKFLELILLELKNRGLLHSEKGRDGGYLLARPADQITVGQIIRVLDGPLALLPCVSVTAYRRCDECQEERACGIRMLFKEIRDETSRLLDGTTLAQLLEREQASRNDSEESLSYQI